MACEAMALKATVRRVARSARRICERTLLTSASLTRAFCACSRASFLVRLRRRLEHADLVRVERRAPLESLGLGHHALCLEVGAARLVKHTVRVVDCVLSCCLCCPLHSPYATVRGGGGSGRVAPDVKGADAALQIIPRVLHHTNLCCRRKELSTSGTQPALLRRATTLTPRQRNAARAPCSACCASAGIGRRCLADGKTNLFCETLLDMLQVFVQRLDSGLGSRHGRGRPIGRSCAARGCLHVILTGLKSNPAPRPQLQTRCNQSKEQCPRQHRAD